VIIVGAGIVISIQGAQATAPIFAVQSGLPQFLPDGRETQFLRPDISDWVAGKGFTIIGQHDAPF
jgi:hypothetical protein